MQNILHHSHNLKPIGLRAASGETQAAANRIPTRPITARCGLVNYEHRRSAIPIAFREIPALKQGDAHSLEIAHAHGATISVWSVVVRFRWMTFESKRTASVNAGQRKIVNGTHGLHTRQSANTFPNLFIERDPLLWTVLRLGKYRPYC